MLLHLKTMKIKKNLQGLEMHLFYFFYLIATFLEPCVMRNTKFKRKGQMCPSR